MTLIGQIFPKLRTSKNMVRSISKKFRFRGSFGKQHCKLAQTLFKFERHHIYHIYWSLWRQLTCKEALLVTCKISTLFPNKQSADGKYSLLNWDNLTQPIAIQLSRKKKKHFLNFIAAFLKSSLNFPLFRIKDDFHSSDISESTDSEKYG